MLQFSPRRSPTDIPIRPSLSRMGRRRDFLQALALGAQPSEIFQSLGRAISTSRRAQKVPVSTSTTANKCPTKGRSLSHEPAFLVCRGDILHRRDKFSSEAKAGKLKRNSTNSGVGIEKCSTLWPKNKNEASSDHRRRGCIRSTIEFVSTAPFANFHSISRPQTLITSGPLHYFLDWRLIALSAFDLRFATGGHRRRAHFATLPAFSDELSSGIRMMGFAHRSHCRATVLISNPWR